MNQFFAGIGGEEKAGQEALLLPHAVGVGSVIETALKAHGVEYATIVCGDNYFHEAEPEALRTIGSAINEFHPDLFLAGPAFNAGRYGLACAKLCSWVCDNWRIPAITGMDENNPGTREIGRHVFVVQTGASTASMTETLKRYSQLIEKLLAQDAAAVENFRAEHCLPIPRRFTVKTGKPDYVRATDLLLSKLNGQAYTSEIPRIETEAHTIPNLAGILSDATVALVTEGGLVPTGNPDRLESSRGRSFSIRSPGVTISSAASSRRCTPVTTPPRSIRSRSHRSGRRDARAGEGAKDQNLHDHYFVTTGTGAMPSKMAELGAGIADEVATAGVNAVILTAT